MSRLPLLPAVHTDGVLGEIHDDLRRQAGPEFEFPGLYRVMGHSPQLLRAWIDFAWPLRLASTTPRPLRELMILRGAQISGARFEWAHHVPMALKAGVSPEQIAALRKWNDSDCFDAREKAVLRVAEELTTGPAASEAAVQGLKTAGFDEGQVVELVLTASFYVCVARFLLSMDIPVEPEYEKYLHDERWAWPG